MLQSNQDKSIYDEVVLASFYIYRLRDIAVNFKVLTLRCGQRIMKNYEVLLI